MSKESKWFQPVKRIFLYKGKELVDPGHHMTPEEVMAMYAHQYPALTKGTISEPIMQQGEERYKLEGKTEVREFKGSYGTKG